MHSHGVVYALAMIASLGKAAIGGAGATLALLGIINAFISAVASSWAHDYAHSGIESTIVPYLIMLGGALGALVGARANKARK